VNGTQSNNSEIFSNLYACCHDDLRQLHYSGSSRKNFAGLMHYKAYSFPMLNRGEPVVTLTATKQRPLLQISCQGFHSTKLTGKICVSQFR